MQAVVVALRSPVAPIQGRATAIADGRRDHPHAVTRQEHHHAPPQAKSHIREKFRREGGMIAVTLERGKVMRVDVFP